MHIPSLRALLLVMAVSIVGCAAVPSTLNTTSWRDPNFNGGPFTRILVIGLSAQRLNDQRGFENLMVSTLQDAGGVAVPGWQFMPTDRPPDPATMRAALTRAGADAALLVRLSGTTTQTSVGYSPGVVAPVGPDMYIGWYDPGLVSDSYQAATVYTTLFDVRTSRPVWTFNPTTYNAASLQQDAPRYANEVATLLRSNGFLPGP